MDANSTVGSMWSVICVVNYHGEDVIDPDRVVGAAFVPDHGQTAQEAIDEARPGIIEKIRESEEWTAKVRECGGRGTFMARQIETEVATL